MSLPILPDSTRDAYLRRLEIETPSLDLNGLTVLQGAHLRRVPFHNLGLLINDGKPYRVPSLVEVAQANTRGIGGTCHLTTPGFATLLRTLGFEVDLIGGAVNHPGDHLLALVHLPQGDYVVDVGNGHPYLSPFPLGHQLSWQAYGWQFFWDGNTLRRRLPDGSIRQVYTVEPTPRAWESFAEAIRAHHEQPGFGPFLASLRAVTLTDDIMLTVRDVELTRYGPLGASRRPLQSAAAARRVLADCLHLEASSVDSALAILEQRRPGMFRGTPAAPRILVAVPTIAREAQLQRLLDSLERDRVRSGLGNDEVEVVILDNVAADPDEKPISFGNFPFKLTRYAITNVCLAREQGLGLLPVERPPMSIGAARHALINIVARTLVDRDENWIVWMLDDDLQFAQLIRDQEGVHEHASIPLLAQARRLWAEHPDISIGLGTFCGDPPIPGFATWLGQLRDLQVTLEAMVDFQPDTAWPQSTVDGSLTEHYYDHAGDKLDTG
ncbi:MAG: arylamine N-acetyltransferase, partial [Nannocystaceae bacterium]